MWLAKLPPSPHPITAFWGAQCVSRGSNGLDGSLHLQQLGPVDFFKNVQCTPKFGEKVWTLNQESTQTQSVGAALYCIPPSRVHNMGNLSNLQGYHMNHEFGHIKFNPFLSIFGVNYFWPKQFGRVANVLKYGTKFHQEAAKSFEKKARIKTLKHMILCVFV